MTSPAGAPVPGESANFYRGNFRLLAHNVLHVVAGLLWFCGLTSAGDRVHAIWSPIDTGEHHAP